MKRIITMTLALAVLLVLAACGDGSGGANGPGSTGNAAGDIRSFAHWGSNLCATEDTVYFICGKLHAQQLFYMDKATGIVGPLCGKPECLHNDNNCNAYLSGWVCGLTLFDGRLYWVENDLNMMQMPIYSVALDGTDRRIVRGMDRDIIGTSLNCSLIQIHDGILYWACSANRIENGEAAAYIRMFAFPLNPEEEGYVILDEKSNLSGQYFHPDGDNVYIGFLKAPEGSDITKLEYALYRWNIKTAQLEALYNAAGPVDGLVGLWPVDGGLVVLGYDYSGLRDTGLASWKIMKYNLETGEFEPLYEETSQDPIWAVAIADGLIIKKMVTEDNELVLLVRDFEGNTVLDKTIPGMGSRSAYTTFSFRGFDEDYFYFYSSHDPESVIIVPRDGSELHCIWSDSE